MNAIPPVSKAGPGVAWRSNFLAFALLPWLAFSIRADPAVLRIRTEEGPLIVSVFSAPTLSSAAPADIAVSVQRRDTGTPLPDADIELQFIPPPGSKPRAMDVFCGPQEQLPPAFRGPGVPAADSVRARFDWPGSRILPGVRIRLPAAGNWTLNLRVRAGSDHLETSGVLPVQGTAGQLRAVWPSLALPPITILLYALNRRLRHSPVPGIHPR
ncbi:MAG: hypothetical protein U1G08_21675 [Verrucomicrobiota bacterium]